MKVKLLTPAEQIELLVIIKKELNSKSELDIMSKYLCNIYFDVTNPPFSFSGNAVFSTAFKYRQKHFHKQVPLFTYANAKQFGASLRNSNGGGWWDCYETKQRVKFLDWLIEENKKLIK